MARNDQGTKLESGHPDNFRYGTPVLVGKGPAEAVEVYVLGIRATAKVTAKQLDWSNPDGRVVVKYLPVAGDLPARERILVAIDQSVDSFPGKIDWHETPEQTAEAAMSVIQAEAPLIDVRARLRKPQPSWV